MTRPWSNGFKLKENMLRLDARKKFFTMRVLSSVFVREVRLIIYKCPFDPHHSMIP